MPQSSFHDLPARRAPRRGAAALPSAKPGRLAQASTGDDGHRQERGLMAKYRRIIGDGLARRETLKMPSASFTP